MNSNSSSCSDRETSNQPENGGRSKAKKPKRRFVARLRGLPWSAREKEIEDFFKDESIVEIQVLYLDDGRASGEALVEFDDVCDLQSAQLKNRRHMGRRYIEIFKASAGDIDASAGRMARPNRTSQEHVIRMRGLPYEATEADVRHFFGNAKPLRVHFVKDDLGRPSGEGFAEFPSNASMTAAMSKHRQNMGRRYIELFRSTREEVRQALGVKRLGKGKKCPTPESTCLLMRGLPYSCTQTEIAKFFQEIDVTPVRIHRKADGAEAYVEFYTIADCSKAMTRHRSYIGSRYIELFRVTYEDMAKTVGLPLRVNSFFI